MTTTKNITKSNFNYFLNKLIDSPIMSGKGLKVKFETGQLGLMSISKAMSSNTSFNNSHCEIKKELTNKDPEQYLSFLFTDLEYKTHIFKFVHNKKFDIRSCDEDVFTDKSYEIELKKIKRYWK